MDSIEWIWLTAILAGIAGGLAGWLVGRRATAAQRKSRALQQSLNDSEQQLRDYKLEVQDHFVQTADAFKQMNESYQLLHRSLASGASALCEDSGNNPLLEKVSGRRADDPEANAAAQFPLQPPLDYAPRSDPADKGVLNEDSDLQKERA